MRALKLLVATFCLAVTLSSSAETYAFYKTKVDAIKLMIDSGISSSSPEEGISWRRAQILQGTKDGIALIKRIIVDGDLDKNVKRVLFQDIAGEIGFAYFEAVKPSMPATMLENTDIVEAQEGEERWSWSYITRTFLPWFTTGVYGIARDFFAAFSPIQPTGYSANGLPEGWVTVDEAGDRQAKKNSSYLWRIPSILPALNVFNHLYSLPVVGEKLPRYGESLEINTWSLAMAKEVQQLYQSAAEQTGESRELGVDAVTLMFKDFLVGDSAGPNGVNGINDSRTIRDGAFHRYQRWLYLGLGSLMIYAGWDFFDAGSPYVTQMGVFMSRISYALMTYGMIRVRTASSTVEAYKTLQGIVWDMEKNFPEVFTEERVAELIKAVDKARASCEDAAKPKKKNKAS